MHPAPSLKKATSNSCMAVAENCNKLQQLANFEQLKMGIFEMLASRFQGITEKFDGSLLMVSFPVLVPCGLLDD